MGHLTGTGLVQLESPDMWLIPLSLGKNHFNCAYPPFMVIYQGIWVSILYIYKRSVFPTHLVVIHYLYL